MEHSVAADAYYQVGAWSPCRTFKDVRDARTQLLRRGREWIKDEGQILKCPYTGAEISFAEVDGGVKAIGAYDPDKMYKDAAPIYHALGMRDGVPNPETTTVVNNEPSGVTVVYEDDHVPFEIKQHEEKASRAKSDGLERTKELAAPIVAELARIRKWKGTP